MADQPRVINHDAEASRVMDLILSGFRSQPAVSTSAVISEFRRTAPTSPVPDSRLLQMLIRKAASHEKAVRFDARSP